MENEPAYHYKPALEIILELAAVEEVSAETWQQILELIPRLAD